MLSNFNSVITKVFEFCNIQQSYNLENEILPIKSPNQGIYLKDFSHQNQKVILASRIPYFCKLFNYSLG